MADEQVKYADDLFQLEIDNKLYNVADAQARATKAEKENPVFKGKFSMNESDKGGSGEFSFITGKNNQGLGEVSFVSGRDNIAAGKHSVVFGNNNIGSYENQFIVGKYNENKETTLVEVGYGKDNKSRRNAVEVTRSGDVVVDGRVLVKDNDEEINLLKEINGIKDEISMGENSGAMGSDFKNLSLYTDKFKIIQFERKDVGVIIESQKLTGIEHMTYLTQTDTGFVTEIKSTAADFSIVEEAQGGNE